MARPVSSDSILHVLYVSVFPIASAQQHDVYADIGHELARRGHTVYTVTPLERRQKGKTSLMRAGNESFLRVHTLNNQKVGAIEKMLALFTTPLLLERAIKKYCKNYAFDLILYDTPFLKLAGPVARLKKRLGGKTYLLLKDIWPKTLVDLGSMRENSALYRYFERQIAKFYAVSDHIGCFSPACLTYVKARYDSPDPGKFEICPHAIAPVGETDEGRAAAGKNALFEKSCATTLYGEKESDSSHAAGEGLEPAKANVVRKSLGVPEGAILFIYGGNFGVPQGVDFIMEAIGSFAGDPRVFFALFGAGTEYERLASWAARIGNAASSGGLANAPANVLVRPHLPKAEYLALLRAADAGLVFLNKHFTVPNIPSRTLDYLQFSLPVVAAVDAATDYGAIIESGGFGLSSLAGDVAAFRANVEKLLDPTTRRIMGEKGRAFFEAHWTAEKACDIILAHFDQEKKDSGFQRVSDLLAGFGVETQCSPPPFPPEAQP